jgi:hypothetical protein
MKLALLLLALPLCVCYGRLGEDLDGFKKRVGVVPTLENASRSGVSEYRFKVDEITVELICFKGVIHSETYYPVTSKQAADIVSKQGLAWKKIQSVGVEKWVSEDQDRAEFSEGNLHIRSPHIEKLLELLKKDREVIESKKTDKF